MVDNRRKKRIEEVMQRELGRILLSYPRQQLFTKITITDVDVAPDLSVAKVFFSVFDGVDIKGAKEALLNETKFLRKTLAHNVNLRLTPKLNFIYDESIKRSKRLVDLIEAAVVTHDE